MDKQFRNLLIIYGGSLVICVLILLLRLKYNKSIFSESKNTCGFWCISHFVMYMCLGYFSPNYWYIALVVSTVWESIEIYMEHIGLPVSGNLTKDIITNSLGLAVGLMGAKFNILK